MKKKFKITKKKIIIFIIIAIIVVAAIVAVKKLTKQEAVASASGDLVAAASGNVAESVTCSGQLIPAGSYQVWPNSGVTGKVIESTFQVGDQVKEGQILYRINKDAVADKILAAKKTYISKQEAYQVAQKNFNRNASKYSKYTVNASHSGYLTNIAVNLGDTVTDGSTVIATVVNNKKMKLTVPFASTAVSQRTVGKSATVQLESGESIRGTVTKVNDYTYTLTGSRVVRDVVIQVKNPGGIADKDSATAKIGGNYSSTEGTFAPYYEGKLTSTVTGIVEDIYTTVGSYVSQGDSVLRIKGDSYDTQMETAKQQLETAKQDMETAKTELETLQKNADDFVIRAPKGGTVVSMNVKEGDVLNETTLKSALCTIYDLSTMKLNIKVDETDIQKLKKGQKVVISADAIPTESYQGVITNISIESLSASEDGSNGGGVTQYPVTVVIKDYGTALPGMNATGTIIVQEANHVVTVPVTALMPGGSNDTGDCVYVKDATATNQDPEVPDGYRKQDVTVGISDGTFIEIKDGVKIGDQVYVPAMIGMGGGFDEKESHSCLG